MENAVQKKTTPTQTTPTQTTPTQTIVMQTNIKKKDKIKDICLKYQHPTDSSQKRGTYEKKYSMGTKYKFLSELDDVRDRIYEQIHNSREDFSDNIRLLLTKFFKIDFNSDMINKIYCYHHLLRALSRIKIFENMKESIYFEIYSILIILPRNPQIVVDTNKIVDINEMQVDSYIILDTNNMEGDSDIILDINNMEGDLDIILDINNMEGDSDIILDINNMEGDSDIILDINNTEVDTNKIVDINEMQVDSYIILDKNKMEGTKEFVKTSILKCKIREKVEKEIFDEINEIAYVNNMSDKQKNIFYGILVDISSVVTEGKEILVAVKKAKYLYEDPKIAEDFSILKENSDDTNFDFFLQRLKSIKDFLFTFKDKGYKITLSDGDLHHNCNFPLFLSDQGDIKNTHILVYKPHSMQTDQLIVDKNEDIGLLAKLQSFFNEQTVYEWADVRKEKELLECLQYHEIGFAFNEVSTTAYTTDFVEKIKNITHFEACSYFFKYGLLLFVGELYSLEDMHQDNIMPIHCLKRGVFPFLCDAEVGFFRFCIACGLLQGLSSVSDNSTSNLFIDDKPLSTWMSEHKDWVYNLIKKGYEFMQSVVKKNKQIIFDDFCKKIPDKFISRILLISTQDLASELVKSKQDNGFKPFAEKIKTDIIRSLSTQFFFSGQSTIIFDNENFEKILKIIWENGTIPTFSLYIDSDNCYILLDSPKEKNDMHIIAEIESKTKKIKQMLIDYTEFNLECLTL